MILRRIPIARQQLESLSEQERALFFFTGHALNELSMLWKLWRASLSVDEAVSEAEHQARFFQQFALGRLLASKVYEAWLEFGKVWGLLQTASTDPRPKLCAAGAASHKVVNRYFGRAENALNQVRNNGGFHYTAQRYEACWREAEDEPGFDLLFGGTVYNNLNAAAERAAAISQLQLTAAEGVQAQARKFLDELFEVSSHLFNVLESAQVLLLERMLGPDWATFGVDERLQPEASLSGPKVPYFVSIAPED
jgi:hypothetical protein